jgi:predicted metal-dependent hydrolase
MSEELSAAERARLMEEGRAAFNRGEFYEAHELWEAVWDVAEDPARTWIQGLIQVATGLHKLDRGRGDVAATLLTKALAKLNGGPASLDGVDVAAARTAAERILAELQGGGFPSARSVVV